MKWTKIVGKPSFLSGESLTTLKSFANDPRGFVIGLVVLWAVNNLILAPTKWTLAWLDYGLEQALGAIRTSVRQAFGTAGASLMAGVIGTPTNPGAIRIVIQELAGILMVAGLGAPIATTVVTVTLVTLFVTGLFLIGRIIVDAIPGGGAFL